MLAKNERKILNLIKYAPIIIVLCLLIISTYMFFMDTQNHYEKNLNHLQKSFIQKSKQRIKNEVNRVYEYILHEKQNSEEDLKNNIKDKVNEVYKVVDFIYNKYKNIESKKQIEIRIKDSLRALTFNKGRGYFYIFDSSGKIILQPTDPNLEGQNLIDFQDKNGDKTLINILNSLKNKEESFNNIAWHSPDDLDNEYKKIVYNKKFEPYNWIIGTGEYLDDFERKLKNRILKYINKISYSKNGYVFVVDYNGKFLAHIKKEYLGVNRISLVDKNGFKITQEIIKSAKKGEAYLNYIGTIKPQTQMPASKITFSKGFEPWQWAIATGFYEDELQIELNKIEEDLEKDKKEKLFKFTLLTLLISFIFLGISWYLSKILEFRFLKHKKQMLNQMKRSRKKDTILSQQSKMAAMGEMIQNIAHQWRQPLNAITTISTAIKFKSENSILDEKEIVPSMENIYQTSLYLSQTIEDFREFFSPDKKMSQVNLNILFDKVLTLLQTQLVQSNIKVIKQIDNVHVNIYQNELIQVFINLINNSKDEFEKKHIKQRMIFIDFKELEDEFIIYFKDNAGGIEATIINRVFDSYFTTKADEKGTGIGLYMSKEIIEKHMNGSIKVYNSTYTYKEEKLSGALFEIRLKK